MYKVLITGASGMVGKAVLLACLDDKEVTEIILLNRKAMHITNARVTEIIVPDFKHLTPLSSQLEGVDACFFCAGVSAAGMSEEKYNELTYSLTLNVAKWVHQVNSNAVFTYVSGAGTDTSENGKIMWARIKGKTENALKNKFTHCYLFRAGYIQPKKGVKSKVKLYRILYLLSKPFYPILKILVPNQVTDSVKVGEAMIYCLKAKPKIQYLENKEINAFAKKYNTFIK